MIKDIAIRISPERENDKNYIKQQILQQLNKENIRAKESEIETVFAKKSIDARRRQVMLNLKYKVYIGEKPSDSINELPQWKKADPSKSVIIIGSGPAGLFAALKLLENGIKPIIIERGSETSERKRDIARISREHKVGEDSNYCFGEGGAGTFSDGKLYTRSNKRGDISAILRIFAHFGADKKILTDAHPHIGTDKLPSIINSMREFIKEMGGEVHFDTKCTDFIMGGTGTSARIKGVKTISTSDSEEKEFFGKGVILATGHSASDIYMMIAKENPEALEQKTFAVGVRVEHPRATIDSIQFHGDLSGKLGAAEYRLTSQQEERGVYSFCMCPGGFVVPSATEPDGIVVNGMSAAGRNSRWSNAAIVVETRPEDIPSNFREESKKICGTECLAGLLWRRWLEKLTFEHGDNQKAPAQRLKDFMNNEKSADLPESSYTPGLVSSNLNEWMPEQISSRLRMGFKYFNTCMKGFITNEAVLIASETRTSTPVRILRDKETFESPSLKGLYPAGEGSGYSGGIVSSAMDGEACALALAKAVN